MTISPTRKKHINAFLPKSRLSKQYRAIMERGQLEVLSWSVQYSMEGNRTDKQRRTYSNVSGICQGGGYRDDNLCKFSLRMFYGTKYLNRIALVHAKPYLDVLLF